MTLRIPPLIQLALAACLGWILTEVFPALAYESSFVWAVGWCFVLGGIAVSLHAVTAFRRAQTTVNPVAPEKTKALVTTGLYKRSRNPMYVGMAAILIGIALLLQSYAALVSVPVLLLAITVLQIMPEEKVLAEKFGDDFDTYCKTARRWL